MIFIVENSLMVFNGYANGGGYSSGNGSGRLNGYGENHMEIIQ
jgi:hypothetical protein